LKAKTTAVTMNHSNLHVCQTANTKTIGDENFKPSPEEFEIKTT
jgi:hypothetical protein